MSTLLCPQRASATVPLRLALDAGDILRLTKGRGTVTVTCLGGTCWLTQAGDPIDHVLRAGSAHVLDGRGLVLIQALVACVVELPLAEVQVRLRPAR
jgi:hypothetical protein